MTKLAIIGSSHCGSIRQSDAQIAAAFPNVKIAYFALPGALFQTAQFDANGIFYSRPTNLTEARMISRINGGTAIDLRQFDLIWVIGFRFGMRRILEIPAHFDILEAQRTNRKRLVSASFFGSAMTAEIQAECRRIAKMFRNDPRVTASPAPYPAVDVCVEGPYHEQNIARIVDHPAGKEIHASFLNKIKRSCDLAGLMHVPQPAKTLAGPFATKGCYLRDARDFRNPKRRTKDMRHMNAEFGFAYFKAFAELHPGFGCTIPKETISTKG